MYDYTPQGPVTDVLVNCENCPTEIIISFESAILTLSAKAECCSKSWFGVVDSTRVSSSEVEAVLQPLVGKTFCAVVTDTPIQPALDTLLALASSPRQNVTLDESITLYIGDEKITLWLLNESNSGHSGSIGVDLFDVKARLCS
jgi:hypothetical protein